MNGGPLVSIAILTQNRCEEVVSAINSALVQDYPNTEIVIVDSASTDRTVETISKAFPLIKLIRLHRNMGCPEGRNVALANCQGEIIISLDDDAVLERSTVSKCVEKLYNDEEAAIIACRIIEPGSERSSINKEHYVADFSGGACAIRRAVIKEVGYFSHDYFRQGEETDLTLRIIEAGHKILYSPDAIIYHNKQSGDRDIGEMLYHSCRNDLLTVIRNAPMVILPILMIWKYVVWNREGLMRGHLRETALASVGVSLRTPSLLRNRAPVSIATYAKYFALRRR
ncbi:MAG: glycosyltransferase family 2 protein [bacterium]